MAFSGWSNTTPCCSALSKPLTHPANFAREKAGAGKDVIPTEEPDMWAVEAVAAYPERNEVERGLAPLKGRREGRPLCPHSEERAQRAPRAHGCVAALALRLDDRCLEQRLREAGSARSAPAAWRALETVRGAEGTVGDRTQLCVTRGSRPATEVLKILKLSDLDPPTPPEGRETIR